jgi:TusE/DsrC/DsvC family sulfur relay protein
MTGRDTAKELERDGDGHLRDFAAWTPAWAEEQARADGLELTADHWQVIQVLRGYYEDFEIAPPIRALIEILRERLQDARFSSRELYRLFPEGPSKQACRYAGLPRPVSCI